MFKQNSKFIHASSVIPIRPYCACEYICLEHNIFSHYKSVQWTKKKNLFVKLYHQEKYLWYFKCSSCENKQARDTWYDKLVGGMQDAQFTIHDCNTNIKHNVIMSEEIHRFIGTSQLRITQFYLVWHKAVFSCQISAGMTSITYQNTEYSH